MDLLNIWGEILSFGEGNVDTLLSYSYRMAIA